VAIDRAKDPSYLSGPSGRDARRSYVEEQYPAFVRNNRPSNADLRRMRAEAAALSHRPLISVLVAVRDPEHGERLGWTLDSVVGQLYLDWELRVSCDGSTYEHAREILSRYERLDGRIRVPHQGRDTGVPGLLNAALSSAEGGFACVLGEGDELAPEALLEVAKLLQNHPEADLIFSDEDTINEAGNRTKPRFKPGWSPDLLLVTDYVSHLAVYRRSLIEELRGFREGFEEAEGHDLALRAVERTEKIHHLPKVLYHRRTTEAPEVASDGRVRDGTRRALSEALERRGMKGSVEHGPLPGTYRVRPKIEGEPKVSIIIPSRDKVSLLRNCVESIERLTTYRNYEILIVDNDSSEPATLEYLAQTPHRVIPFKEEFNYARINNLAVKGAEGEYVLLLNDDTEVIDGGWLEAMLEHAQRPEVGAVGAKLLYPDGRVQHAGVLTGVGGMGFGIARHSYQYYRSEDPGHMGTLATTTNYSAVTAACMLLRKSVYDEVGGFDEENLRVSFNDVDLCLRIRERGYLVVYTPHARLYHHESASRDKKANPAESLYMLKRWEGPLDRDPYYNPNFSRGSGDFNLRADLLRPRVLRQGGNPEDPASPFDGLLPATRKGRTELTKMLQGVLTADRKERKRLIETHQRTIRDSYRTTLIPGSDGLSLRLVALEGFGQQGRPGALENE
jgi:O-antigen biosynthesis protein